MNQKGFANIILVVVIVILLGVVGYFALVKKSEPIAQQTPISTPPTTQTPTQQTPAPKDETVNWKTYTNTNRGYSIKYPSDWAFEEQGNGDGGLFKDKNGKSTIQNALYLRDLNDGYQDTLEKAVKSGAEREYMYMGVSEAENITFKTIADDSKTLGYFSQRKIFSVDKTFSEMRADFESKLAGPFVTATGKYKMVISFVAQQNSTDAKLFELIVSTFKFTQ
ncbi:MAG: PsbP-related protein [Patescibacteria group bacterium]